MDGGWWLVDGGTRELQIADCKIEIAILQFAICNLREAIHHYFSDREESP